MQHLFSFAPPANPPALPHVGTSSNLIHADGIIITGWEFGDDVNHFAIITMVSLILLVLLTQATKFLTTSSREYCSRTAVE